MAEELKIISANAGSGKTHHIVETLTGWVRDGTVSAGKVLAVTYTEAAAYELRDRILSRLLQEGRIEDMLAMDAAHISTIHALGQRLLTEHAFAAGASPSPRLLEPAESDFLLRDAMSKSNAFKDIMGNLKRHGFRSTFIAADRFMSVEDHLRKQIRSCIDQLRALGSHGGRADIACKTEDDLRKCWGGRERDGKFLGDMLHKSVMEMIELFPADISGQFSAKTVRDRFGRDHLLLRQAKNRDRLDWDWFLWAKLADLSLGSTRSAPPDEYLDCARNVIEAARQLDDHPGPLEDAVFMARKLIDGSRQIIADYATMKRRLGVMDFSDMISGAENLLRGDGRVLNSVLGEIDCVVIDEFQDTNPVQFALLWMLARNSPRAILVGDKKQSIMGFQGADVRLMEALTSQFENSVSHLPCNWRSGRGLVNFFNAVSSALFGQDYRSSKPVNPEPDLPWLQFLMCPNSRRARGGKTRPHHVTAMHVADMIDGGQMIVGDGNALRPVRPEDIAVLCLSHSQMANYADALRKLHIPVRVQADGWLDSQCVSLARYALAFAADPDDSHAAMGWLTLGPETVPVEFAMKLLVDGEICQHPALERLAALAAVAQTASLPDFVAKVLDASGLEEWALTQHDAEQFRADLLRFRHEAMAFAGTDVGLREMEGFFGEVAQAFLGWLQHRSKNLDGNRRPNREGLAGKGVELTTWFGAKGREWPVVVVAQLDDKFVSRLGEIKVEFDDFGDLENVLQKSWLRVVPYPASKEIGSRFIDRARPQDELNVRRLLYVALTRARDCLILEWPRNEICIPSNADRESYADFIAENAKFRQRDNALAVDGKEFPCIYIDGPSLQPDELREPPERNMPDKHVISARGPKVPDPVEPWRIQPSQLPPGAERVEIRDIELAAGATDLGIDSSTERGTAAHLAIRAFMSNPGIDGERVSDAAGIMIEKLGVLRNQAISLRRWLDEQGLERRYLELPLQKTRSSGSQINAIVDCLAEGRGKMIIVDYKTGKVDDTADRFAKYLPQLRAYAELALETFPGRSMMGLAVFWIDTGVLSLHSGPYAGTAH